MTLKFANFLTISFLNPSVIFENIEKWKEIFCHTYLEMVHWLVALQLVVYRPLFIALLSVKVLILVEIYFVFRLSLFLFNLYH